ncbi:alpha/beta fold hydrolase, partial [Lacticaseibacillus rhamnosus]
DRPVVVLLHGLASDSTTWQPALEWLPSHGLRVVAPDLLGHGESDKPLEAGYLLADYADRLYQFLTMLGHRSVTLVGHSYGGLIGREAVLAAGGAGFASFTLMSSGPGALTGPRAGELGAMLTALGAGAVVDAANEYVMPGLIEMHAHLDDGYGGNFGRVWLAYGITSLRIPSINAYAGLEQREAFDATMRDPDFVAEATRSKLAIEPVGGAQLAALVERIHATPKEIVAKVAAMMK